MLLNVLQIADIAGAAIVPTMERRRRRKNFNAALQAHQESEGQFDYVPRNTSSFDAQAFRKEQDAREVQIATLQKKLGLK